MSTRSGGHERMRFAHSAHAAGPGQRSHQSVPGRNRELAQNADAAWRVASLSTPWRLAACRGDVPASLFIRIAGDRHVLSVSSISVHDGARRTSPDPTAVRHQELEPERDHGRCPRRPHRGDRCHDLAAREAALLVQRLFPQYGMTGTAGRRRSVAGRSVRQRTFGPGSFGQPPGGQAVFGVPGTVPRGGGLPTGYALLRLMESSRSSPVDGSCRNCRRTCRC